MKGFSMSRLDAIKQKRQEAKTRGVRSFNYVDTIKLERLGIVQFKPVDGDNFIFIIPPADENEYYGKEIWRHNNIGVDGITLLCPKKMLNKHCPICADILRLKAADPQDEAIQDLRPGQRFLFFVVDARNSETEKKGPQWYDAPVSVNDSIVKIAEDKRTGEAIDVSNPNKAYNVVFEKTGSQKKTRYGGFILEPRTTPIQSDWLDVPKFDDILNIIDPDVIEAAYSGMTKDSSEPGHTRHVAPPENEPPERHRAEEPAREEKAEAPRSRRDLAASDKQEIPRSEAPPERRRAEAAVEEPEDNNIHTRVRSRLNENHAEEEQPPRRRS
jgi:hypothetical protein